MKNLEDIILHETECGYVEFKTEQYFENGFTAFVKDLMAMANSSYEGDKYIIIGVQEKNRIKTLEGLSKPLQDPAHYDQVIHANIEPEIQFSSQTVQVEGLQFGVFAIGKCDDKPYMMKKDMIKKDLSALRKGECYIRKGTTVDLLIRRDLDAIWEQKMRLSRFDGDVNVSYLIDSRPDGTVPIQRLVILPSDREANVIEQTLKNINHGQPYVSNMIMGAGPGRYGHMTVEVLRDELRRIKTTFHDEDLYEKFEKLGTKLNFILTNTGSMHIEDVTVIITLPAIPGLEIAPRLYHQNGAMMAAAFQAGGSADGRLSYPIVKEEGGNFEIRQPFGTLRHGIPTNSFTTEIRLFADHQMAGKQVQARITIHGKNLAKALERQVLIGFEQ